MTEENGIATAIKERVKAAEGRSYLRRKDFGTDSEWRQYKLQQQEKRRKKIENGGEITATDAVTLLTIQAVTVRKIDLSNLKPKDRFVVSLQGGPIYVKWDLGKVLNLTTGQFEKKTKGDVFVLNLMGAIPIK